MAGAKKLAPNRLALAALVAFLVFLCLAIDRRHESVYRPSTGPVPGSCITRQNVAAIEFGMQLDQVVAMLGAHRSAGVDLDLDGPEARQQREDSENIMFDIDFILGNTWYQSEYWEGEAGTAWVCFNKDGRVASKAFIPVRR